MGNQVEKSQVHKKGGKNPKWDQTLTLRRLEHNYLEIKVKDKDQFSDDLIGEAQIPLYSILKNAENKQYKSTIELKYKNKNAGSINLEWKWNPEILNLQDKWTVM
ncbi:C2 domain [Pseudocohnilembus persalinus]|uniref:C2 domain n=1 Tax=Pseudocohnilembus persalinus TaxID=266149 RepID=A0A0V0QVA9_PSEPJ|nr:C2 domain [Pseudocohnilembus persalinus]|eukprot:KRX06300.1 C2 domain [Pseudocohnilembus persalinus]